jgi:transposase
VSEARVRLVYEVVRRHDRGEGIRAIARALHLDRKTVRKMVQEVELRRREGDDAQPASRAPRVSKLDPYIHVIAELLHRYPDLRAKRLHEELVERGFTGGYTIVREYLKDVRPPPSKRPAVLVRTGPGQQAQVDWSPYHLANGTPIYCFSFVLGFSRFLYARFRGNSKQHTVFRELRRAFDVCSGVPGECVFDSMPGIVDRWELDEPVLNVHAVSFATYYGFEIHVAPRADGAYKGKVERPFRFIEESLLNGRTFHTLEQANEALSAWLERRANPRVHRMTRRRPVDALEDDRAALRPVPVHPYDDRELAYRVVDSYGYVDFDGNHYRAPTRIGSWIYVRAGDHEVAIAAGPARIIATHPRAPHNANAWVPPPKHHQRRPIGELMASFESWGTTALRYALEVRKRKRYAAAELGRILALRSTYALEDLLAAVEHAARYDAYDARAIERILEARAVPRSYEDHFAAKAQEHIRRMMAQAPVKQRGLETYARLLARPAPDPGAHCEHDDGATKPPSS